MDTIDLLCESLEQKRLFFMQYEEATDQMLVCEIDKLDQYITKRQQLAIEIDKIDAEIASICATDPDGEMLADSAASRGHYGALNDDLKQVYNTASPIYAIIGRIYQKEPQIVMRLESEKERVEELIKASANTPKLMKYFSGLGGGPVKGTYLGTKYDKV